MPIATLYLYIHYSSFTFCITFQDETSPSICTNSKQLNRVINIRIFTCFMSRVIGSSEGLSSHQVGHDIFTAKFL